MSSERNLYCSRLNLPVPRVEDRVGSPNVKLFHLLVVALLEQGEPMTLEAIAQRLAAAGVRPSTGDMLLSLRKAWHGNQPVYRDAQGRMCLDVQSPRLRSLLFRLGLDRTASPRPAEPAAQPPQLELPPDDVPLNEAEVQAALAARTGNLSTVRMMLAVLDQRGTWVGLEELMEYLSKLSGRRLQPTASDLKRLEKLGVHVDGEGRRRVDRSATEVLAMRKAIRKVSHRILVREAQAQYQQQRHAQWKVEHQRRREQARREAAGLKRALLRVYPGQGAPEAAALLDIGTRKISTFVGEQLAELPRSLEDFDLIAAAEVRQVLSALGIADADRFRLADLKPPQKSRRLNRQGRTLPITLDLLITSTTGISRPLGDAKMASYLAQGQLGKLRRRLEADVKALYAFYHYGALHRCVRLRWGFLDELLPADWAQEGDEALYEILSRCEKEATPVEMVWGSAPGWSEPWSRARRVTVRIKDVGTIEVNDGLERQYVWRYDVQAVRVAEDRQATGKQPVEP